MIAHRDDFSPALIEVENLRVRFTHSGPWVVKGVSFQVRRGDCLAIIGESGSGKSVTARALLGLAGERSEVQADRLYFDGEDLTRFSSGKWREIRGNQIGFVMQDALGSLDPLRLVGREIAEPLEWHRPGTRQQHWEKVVELLRSVEVPEPEVKARQYPHQLSGGLRQRALIASAIACNPDLLIADEPTTALDAVIQAQVLRLFASLRKKTNALLLISHDLGVVSHLADRVAVMQHGVIVEEGTVQTILQDPQHEYTKTLLSAVPRFRSRGGSRSSTRVPEIGESSRVSPQQSISPLHSSGNDFVLEARELKKTFIGPDGLARTVVNHVTFGLRPGETLGLVGESGSGKSTVARLLLALEKPDSGSVFFRGQDWFSLTPAAQRAERKRVQVVFQDPLRSFDPRYTVDRVIGEALDVLGPQSSLQRRQRIERLLEMVRLDTSISGRRPIELSGGQRQRVAIARAVAAEPEVLICDEPVSALDASVQGQILQLLSDLQQRLGLSCLFISHDLAVIQQISHRILVMQNGFLVESGDVEEVFDRPQHPYTRTLLEAIPDFPIPLTTPNLITEVL